MISPFTMQLLQTASLFFIFGISFTSHVVGLSAAKAVDGGCLSVSAFVDFVDDDFPAFFLVGFWTLNVSFAELAVFPFFTHLIPFNVKLIN